MGDLIDDTRAKMNINQASYTSGENTLIDALITAASDYIERYCHRTFTAETYYELVHGNDTPQITLKRFPVTTIVEVLGSPTEAMTVTNTSSSNQIATAKTTYDTTDASLHTEAPSGFSLTRVASGTVTTNAIAFASYATIGLLAAQVTATSSGWSGTANTTYTNFPSLRLFPRQGPLNCKDVTASFYIHSEMVSNYMLDPNKGILTRLPYTDRNNPTPLWERGFNNYWVKYGAGWTAVPEAVQAACAMTVAMMFKQAKRDSGLISEKSADYFFQTEQLYYSAMPEAARLLLSPYRRILV